MIYNAEVFSTKRKEKKKFFSNSSKQSSWDHLNKLLQFSVYNCHISNSRILDAHLCLKAIVFPISRFFNANFIHLSCSFVFVHTTFIFCKLENIENTLCISRKKRAKTHKRLCIFRNLWEYFRNFCIVVHNAFQLHLTEYILLYKLHPEEVLCREK